MKAKEVLKILQITRQTLSSYVRTGKVKVVLLDNGRYRYDPQSVYFLAKLDVRKNYIYARVSTHKQAPDLKNQIYFIKDFCTKNKIRIDDILSDISSGLNFDRKSFSFLFDEIINFRVGKIIISYKDRLTRYSFSMIESVFNKFGTKIVVINDLDNEDTHNELLDEVISIMHSLSTKIYSARKYSNHLSDIKK